MHYFIVGGSIRDLLLGTLPKDHDIVFDAAPCEFITANPKACKVESIKDIYLLNGHEYTALHVDGIRADLMHRDFTINSFLLEENGALHMHPDALEHLMESIIHPSSEQSFIEDPARIFRAARLAACLPGFWPSEYCFTLMREAAKKNIMSKLPPERISRELILALNGHTPGNFLRVLNEGECFYPWFKELEGTDQIPAGPEKYHHASVMEHTAEIMDFTTKEVEVWARKWKNENPEAADGVPFKEKSFAHMSTHTRKIAVWMALCHDLGKGLTPEDMLPHHYRHEIHGPKLAEALAMRLAMPVEYRKAGPIAARLHMKAGRYGIHRPGVRVDMLTASYYAHVALPLFLVAQADSGNNKLWDMARKELEIILQVSLPKEWQNKGPESGAKLRDLRCMALPNKINIQQDAG